MRFIPSRVHGVLDYLSGLLMLATPFLLGMGGHAAIVLWAMGALAILYSLFTDYELGLVRVLGLPTHLSLDVLGGMFLVASPFILGFGVEVGWPHIAFGAFSIIAGAFTRAAPDSAPAEVLRV